MITEQVVGRLTKFARYFSFTVTALNMASSSQLKKTNNIEDRKMTLLIILIYYSYRSVFRHLVTGVLYKFADIAINFPPDCVNQGREEYFRLSANGEGLQERLYYQLLFIAMCKDTQNEELLLIL